MTLHDYFSQTIQTGRIGEIGRAACEYFNRRRVSDLTPLEKLDSLSAALCVAPDDLDSIIADSPEVKRTVKGHAFEIIFEKMMRYNGISCEDIGGDSDIDLIVNGVPTQLKTQYAAGCSENIVSYKTHKTHGAKSELESLDYYHKVSDFADYLIGLVTLEPFQVVIIPREELPRVSADSRYIQSPMFIDISNRHYINQFKRLGIYQRMAFPEDVVSLSRDEILPLSAAAMSMRSEYILEAIFREENFRIWDMNMRGFIRENALSSAFDEHGVSVFSPTVTGLPRPEKSDLVLQRRRNGQYVRFQVKGLTYSGCRFDGRDSRIDCETQLSRGRVNDHPTQSRLYQTTDFEYVIMAFDPPYSNRFSLECYGVENYYWTFYAVPTRVLTTHKKYPNRIASHQYIDFLDMAQYQIDHDWFNQWV